MEKYQEKNGNKKYMKKERYQEMNNDKKYNEKEKHHEKNKYNKNTKNQKSDNRYDREDHQQLRARLIAKVEAELQHKPSTAAALARQRIGTNI
eukprot:3784914-Amphidinium_carterae.1